MEHIMPAAEEFNPAFGKRAMLRQVNLNSDDR
jgi:hypothetical protein